MNIPSEEQTKADIELLDSLLGIEARKPGKAAGLPAAIRIIETLEPAGGINIPVFPASYAGAGDNDPPVYDLAGIEYGEGKDLVRVKGGKTGSVQRILKARFCAIDSPQSQANRMEPAFLESDELKALVPQGVATIPKREAYDDSVLLLPHRVADFRVRRSNRGTDASSAITAFQKGNALPLLRLFPTSLIFGFWDSRGEEEHGVKHARMLLSRIDAHDVIPCRRHSLYSGPYSKDEFAGVVLGREDMQMSKEEGDRLSKEGFSNAPSDGLGGVLVQGKIERTSVLSLTDIARIHCDQPRPKEQQELPAEAVAKAAEESKPTTEQLTNAARRYLFSLAALAEGHERSKGSHRLRSGCELIAVREPKFELRGAKFAKEDELEALYNNCARLIAVAKEAKEILSVPAKLDDFVVSAATLRGKLLGADELAKEIEKLTKEVERGEDKAAEAEKDAEKKEAKAAESSQKRDQTSAQKAREKVERLRREVEEAKSKLRAKSQDNASTSDNSDNERIDGPTEA
jgi:CRISPR-associated protein Csb1